jgi:hypothetical protein
VARTAQLNLLYRIHVFNFLFSLFTLATGYVDLTRNLVKHSAVNALNTMEGVSLAGAHVVVLVYLCCPRRAMEEGMLMGSSDGDGHRIPEHLILQAQMRRYEHVQFE